MSSLLLTAENLLKSGLSEDQAQWDFTTQAAIKARDYFSKSKSKTAKSTVAHVTAKSDCIWAANFLLEALSTVSAEQNGSRSSIDVESDFADGDFAKAGSRVCTLTGSAEQILTFERTFLNLAAYVCGVATRTYRLVEAAEKAAKKKSLKEIPRITATRKSLPHYRDLAIQGVILGGGFPHRLNLAGGVLIKENHITVAGGITQAVLAASGTAPHTLRIEVEVKNLKELKEAISAGADGVMLDNFSPAEVKKALTLCDGVFVEVSGGINENNIGDYLIPGIHILSSGSITQNPYPVDLSLLIE